MSKKNPYKIIRRAAWITGNVLIGAALAVFVIATHAALWIKGELGAWSLLLIPVVVAGGAALALLSAAITTPFKMFGSWWKKKEREHG